MQLIFDHSVAFLLAAAIVFTLAGLALRGQNAAIESTQYYDARANSHALIELLEQDLLNLGGGIFDINVLPNVLSFPAGQKFSFVTLKNHASADTHRVEYKWEQVGTVALRDTVKSTYRVTRTAGGTKSTFDGVTEFNVTLRDRFLAPVTVAANVGHTRRIDVTLAIVSGLGVSETVEETHWNSAFRPLNLQRLEGNPIIVLPDI